jgi:RNA polymerase sigma factor (sigma-70 family)
VVPADPYQAALLESIPRLRVSCRRLAPSDPLADDLLQDTLLRAIERPPADRNRALHPWLVSVARNLSIDRWRKQRRVTLDGELAEKVADTTSSPLQQVITISDAGRRWLAALSRLTVRQRAVFLLCEVLDHSGPEAAELLDMREGAVRASLSRAREAVRSTRDCAAPEALLEMLVSQQVKSLGDLLRSDGIGHARLLIGPVEPGLWRVLLDLLVKAAGGDSLRSAAHAGYLSGAAALVDGDRDEARMLLEAALQHAEALGDLPLQWLIRHELVVTALRAYDLDEAEQLLAQSSRQRATRAQKIWLGSVQANIAWRSGDATAAEEAIEDSLKSARDPYSRMMLSHNLAVYANRQGRWEEALGRVRASIDGFEASGDRREAARAWNTLGMALQNLARFDEAEAAFRRSEELAVQCAGPRGGADAINNLGLLRAEQGQLAEAAALARDASDRAEGQDPLSVAIASANLGLIAHMRGDLPAAITSLDRAAEMAGELKNQHLLAHVLAHRAAAKSRGGSPFRDDLQQAEDLSSDDQKGILAILAHVATSSSADAAADALQALLAEPRERLRSCTERLALRLLMVAVDGEE